MGVLKVITPSGQCFGLADVPLMFSNVHQRIAGAKDPSERNDWDYWLAHQTESAITEMKEQEVVGDIPEVVFRRCSRTYHGFESPVLEDVIGIRYDAVRLTEMVRADRRLMDHVRTGE